MASIMEQELTKELVKKLMKLKGQGRGMNLKNDADFVLKKKSRKGLEELEKELEQLGCPIKYDEIRAFDFYPIAWRAISLLAIKKVFNWGDEDIRELCAFSTYVSLIMKIFTEFLASIDKLSKQGPEYVPKMWREYFTEGQIELSDYDLDKKYVVIELKDFPGHPIFCRCLEGYFARLTEIMVKAKPAKCRELKCQYKGDDHHEFRIEW